MKELSVNEVRFTPSQTPPRPPSIRRLMLSWVWRTPSSVMWPGSFLRLSMSHGLRTTSSWPKAWVWARTGRGTMEPSTCSPPWRSSLKRETSTAVRWTTEPCRHHRQKYGVRATLYIIIYVIHSCFLYEWCMYKNNRLCDTKKYLEQNGFMYPSVVNASARHCNDVHTHRALIDRCRRGVCPPPQCGSSAVLWSGNDSGSAGTGDWNLVLY